MKHLIQPFIKSQNQLLKVFLVLLVSIAALVFLAPGFVGAQSVGNTSGGIQGGLEQGSGVVDPQGATQNPAERIDEIIRTIINIFSLIVGVVSVVMIIVGGLKYITSGGESSNVTSAKNTILYAIVGLVIVALSQIIVRFVVERVTDI